MEWLRVVRVLMSALLLLCTALAFLLPSLLWLYDLGIQRGRGILYATKGWKYFQICYSHKMRACRKGAKRIYSVSQELWSCVTPSPEPCSKTRAWLWGLMEGYLLQNYFFPLNPCELHPLMLPKSPPLSFLLGLLAYLGDLSWVPRVNTVELPCVI